MPGDKEQSRYPRLQLIWEWVSVFIETLGILGILFLFFFAIAAMFSSPYC